METNEKEVLAKVIAIIVDLVNEAGADGVPSGYLYAALNSQGMSLVTYNSIIAGLVDLKKIKLSNHVLYPVG